jgi:hypothetical protein
MAAHRHGGLQHWAEQFGVPYIDPKKLWPAERIERELGEFVRGANRMPRRREFKKAGLGKLHAAMQRHKGLAHWARHFELEYAARSPGGPSQASGQS